MRFVRYLLVPWTMIVVYALFSFFLGQNGLYARKHLESELLRLQEHEKSLAYTKQDFREIKDNLVNDPDAFAVYARQLGYGTETEQFIRIRGLNVAASADVPIGRVLYAVSLDYVSDTVIKFIAAFFALVVLVFFLVRDIFSFR